MGKYLKKTHLYNNKNKNRNRVLMLSNKNSLMLNIGNGFKV
jgi:hypothetical protein